MAGPHAGRLLTQGHRLTTPPAQLGSTEEMTMHANLNLCRRVYRLAESFGHAFSANVYLSLRADGWNAEGALQYARRAYCGQAKAYRPRELRQDYA